MMIYWTWVIHNYRIQVGIVVAEDYSIYELISLKSD